VSAAHPRRLAIFRCTRALAWCLATAWWSQAAHAATLGEKAKESGCLNKPALVSGTALYKCETHSGPLYFNVPDADTRSAEPVSRRVPPPAVATVVPVAPPSAFPRVDAATQRGREDVRRKVLGDELSTEERLLAEARTAFANGAPTPLPEEQANADKYRDRIARLRQSIALHERNVEALRKEIGNIR
jgi:hypothetical protein